MSISPSLSGRMQSGLGAIGPDDIKVVIGENPDEPKIDDKGNIIKIVHGDGSVTVSLDGKGLGNVNGEKDKGWWDNLAEEIETTELSRISSDLLRNIEYDIDSRKEWIEDRALGLKLLGLKIELPGVGGSADGAPVEGMSKVRHPLLLEAVLRFQANARSELLPTDGPVKIRVDTNNGNVQQDQLANALENDLNHYLTSTATEYYPDTDRMLLMLGFSGTAFKKVYFCPLRNRPVSETVDASDLIVNETATDLRNAKRITHRTTMRKSDVVRMQILRVYKDVPLSTPVMPELDALQREKLNQQGLNPSAMNPDDRDREIYECYCELDIKGFEHKHKGSPSGLEIPYRVTIDVSTKQILSIVRNYDEDSADLPEARPVFVKYTFVPGFGFLDIGLLHILGNTTNAITAAWREMLDAGMFASFPGFLFAKSGARQQTNVFRVPPGGGAPVETGGMPITQAIMPLPYKDISPTFGAFIENIAQTGMRIGGTSEQQVGEGRADAPVGTTLAMIEQATKVLNAVHKRMHAAQAEEFQLLVKCFKENPESFWQSNKKPAYQWDEQTFLQALDDVDLVPQADPNTASHAQRVMKIMALKQLQAQNPTMYDPIAIDTAALQAIGWSNPEQFLAPPAAQSAPPPEMQKQMAEAKVKQQEADAKTTLAQAKAEEMKARVEDIKSNMGKSPENHQSPVDLITAKAKMMDAETRRQQVNTSTGKVALEDKARQEDRESREKIQLLEMARDIVMHPASASMAEPLIKQAESGDKNDATG